MFVSLSKLAVDDCRATVQICFRDLVMIMNTTKLLSMFCNQTIIAHRYVAVSSPEICNLQRRLLRWYLATTFLGIWRFKTCVEALRPLQSSESKEIDLLVPAVSSMFASFANAATTDPAVRDACVLIIRILSSLRGSAVLTLFRSPRVLFCWMGDLCESSPNSFGVICAALAVSDEARTLVLSSYLHAEFGPLAQPALLSLSRICGFVTLLLASLNTELVLDPTKLQSAVKRSAQMISIQPSPSIDLITAICRYYNDKLVANAPQYTDHFWNFRFAMIYVFDQKLDFGHSLRSLEALSYLMCRKISTKDSTKFTVKFMGYLLGFMAAQQEKMVFTAWSLFRNWVLIDSRTVKMLERTDHLRVAFEALLATVRTNITMIVQLLLAYHGMMKNSDALEYVTVSHDAQLKKWKSFLTAVLAAQKLQIAQLQEILLASQGKPEAAKYDAEIKLLNGIWKKRRLSTRWIK
jgi:hypothetical protein